MSEQMIVNVEDFKYKSFTIYLTPRGQARPRHATIRKANGKSFDRIYKTDAQEADENQLGLLMLPHAPGKPYAGPIKLCVRACFEVPVSWPKKRRQDALENRIFHTTKPDLDNIIKHVMDVGTGIFWCDDRQICGISGGTGKYYDQVSHYEIEVGFVPGMQDGKE